MIHLFRTVIDRIKFLLATSAALELEADALARHAERKAELLRLAQQYESEKLPAIAQEWCHRAEALDLLKAWGTGHPGGIGTIHAGSATGALHRLEQLIQEVVVTVPRVLIAEAINVIAVLAGRGTSRRLIELAVVEGVEPGGAYVLAQAVKRNGDL